ncbi:MAG: EH signature domain-containing protein [Sterolibacterium sp.]|nr:EH signature domain-containing protein [Sterolibacterium sp.]
MPDRQTMSISPLADLDGRLAPFRNGISASPEWHARRSMAEMLGMIRNRHQSKERLVRHALILESVVDYLRSGKVMRPADISLLCLGAGWLDGEGRGILADRKLRRKLLILAQTITGRRSRLKAFRSLLYAYWSFPLHDAATSTKAVRGWRELRDWLKVRRAEINLLPSRKPMWFNILGQHLHLLDENPCAKYAKALLRGNMGELQHAIDCLFIPADSWLKTEAVMAQITEASQWQDEAFHALLPGLLKLATGDAGIRLTDGVTRRAIARLVMRYARQKQHQPHEDLFILALGKFGNPWRQQPSWDVLVCDEGGNPCLLSREMVSAWLKDRMIGEFFEDGGGEESRSELWRKYAVFMQMISLAVPWKKDRALVVRIGEFLVIVPQKTDESIVTYPWETFVANGGARLLDKDAVDGVRMQKIIDHCRPALRLGQANPAQCDRMLRGMLLSSGAREN